MFSFVPKTLTNTQAFDEAGDYRISFKYKVGNLDVNSQIITYNMVDKAFEKSDTRVQTNGHTSWQTFTRTISITEGSTIDRIQAYAIGGAQDFYIDDIIVEKLRTLTPQEIGMSEKVVVYEDFTGKTQYAGNASYLKPGFEAAFGTPYGAAAPGGGWTIVDDSGNKVLKAAFTGSWQALFNLVPASAYSKAGSYIISFKYKPGTTPLTKADDIRERHLINGSLTDVSASTVAVDVSGWQTCTQTITVGNGGSIGQIQYQSKNASTSTSFYYIDDITVVYDDGKAIGTPQDAGQSNSVIIYEDFTNKVSYAGSASYVKTGYESTFGNGSGVGNATWSIVADPANASNKVLQASVTGTYQALFRLVPDVPCSDEGDYKISFKYKVATGGNTSSTIHAFGKVNGAQENHLNKVGTNGHTDWHTYTHTMTVESGKTLEFIQFYDYVAGTTFYIDDITVEKVKIPTPQEIGMSENVLLYEDFTNKIQYAGNASYLKPGFEAAFSETVVGAANPNGGWSIVNDSGNKVLKASFTSGTWQGLFRLVPTTAYTTAGNYIISFKYKPGTTPLTKADDIRERHKINDALTDASASTVAVDVSGWQTCTQTIAIAESGSISLIQYQSMNASTSTSFYYIDDITVVYDDGKPEALPTDKGLSAKTVSYDDFEGKVEGSSDKLYLTYGAEGTTRTMIGRHAFAANQVRSFAKDPTDADNMTLKLVGDEQWENTLLTLGTTVNAGDTFKLSYRVYAEPVNATFTTETIAWQVCRMVPGSNSYYQMQDTKFTVDNINQWLSYEISYEADIDFNEVTFFPTNNHATKTANFYIDDIVIEIIRPYKANAVGYFATADGDDLGSVANGSVATTYTLPTAATLGLDYNVKYTDDNGSVFYPGMKRTLADGDDTINFTVSADNGVIFFQDGDDAEVEMDIGEATSATSVYTTVGKIGDRKALIATVKNGWNQIDMINGLTISSEGVYTVSYDVYVDYEESDYPTENAWPIYMLTYGASSTISDGMADVPANPTMTKDFQPNEWATISQSFAILTETEEGEHYGKKYYITGHEEKCYLDNADNYGILPRIVLVTDAKNGTEKMPPIYFDNITIEYTAFEPTTLQLAQVRAENENGEGPAGIRFASYVTESQKKASAEYGYLVGLATQFTDDTFNLTGATEKTQEIQTLTAANGSKIIAAAAYIVDGCDRVYSYDGSVFGADFAGLDEIFFTGVIHGYGENKDAQFIVRPYVLVDGVYYYGDTVTRSHNDVANENA